MIKRKEVIKVLELDNLAAGATSNINDSKVVDLTKASSLAVTAECKFATGATNDVRVDILADVDGGSPDTIAFDSITLTANAGKRVQRTKALDSDIAYLRAKVVNLDSTAAVSDVKVYAVVGYEE